MACLVGPPGGHTAARGPGGGHEGDVRGASQLCSTDLVLYDLVCNHSVTDLVMIAHQLLHTAALRMYHCQTAVQCIQYRLKFHNFLTKLVSKNSISLSFFSIHNLCLGLPLVSELSVVKTIL